MNVMVTTEHRFYGSSDGKVWTSGQFPYSYFTRYLEVFDHVLVVARVGQIDRVPDAWHSAEGSGVSFVPVPYYLGPIQFALQAITIRRTIRRAVRAADAAIFRAPSIIANLAERQMKRCRQPYALEIVGDPSAVFARGVVDHPLRPLFRIYGCNRLRQQCRDAIATAYLTKGALKRLYPPGSGMFQTSYPEVELKDEAFALVPPTRDFIQKPLTLLGVGSLAQRYKGFDVLMRALKTCLEQGLDLRLVLAGDGQYRAELEALAARLHVQDRVVFLGQLPSGKAVRDQFDQAHMFVMPSRVEGMPSAMIEAMARGLPCIGSTVGGIPELLPAEDLVVPGDAPALAAKVREIVTDPGRMTRMAAKNLATSRQFRDQTLHGLRTAFYRHVRERTEAWQRSGKVAHS